MMNYRYLIFILIAFFSFDANAMSLPISTLSDTCVEIKLKSGKLITAKISSQTKGYVYFKKCDDLDNPKLYFIPKSRIDSIKSLDVEAWKAQTKEKEISLDKVMSPEKKQRRIFRLLGLSMAFLFASFILLSAFPNLPILFLITSFLFVITSLWGLGEVLSYKGKYPGKEIAMLLLLILAGIAIVYAFRFVKLLFVI